MTAMPQVRIINRLASHSLITGIMTTVSKMRARLRQASIMPEIFGPGVGAGVQGEFYLQRLRSSRTIYFTSKSR